jgi:hypothetical protein
MSTSRRLSPHQIDRVPGMRSTILLENNPTRATTLVSSWPLDTVRTPARDGSDSTCLLEASESTQSTILRVQLFCFAHLDLDRPLFLSLAAGSKDGERCLANHGGTLSHYLYYDLSGDECRNDVLGSPSKLLSTAGANASDAAQTKHEGGATATARQFRQVPNSKRSISKFHGSPHTIARVVIMWLSG